MKIRGNVWRRSIFWIHLVSGLVAGVVIAIMSVTGIAIAFEEEILEWVDRDLSSVTVPADGAALSIEELHGIVQRERPDFPANYVTVSSQPEKAYEFYVGRQGPVYANPYTGELSDTQAESTHDFIHLLEEWHRFLGMEGEHLPVGRLITGICNLAFLLLCLTGLYLWFPAKWSVRALKSILLFRSGAKGKARDYNWHNVFGFWSLPVLAILAGTAVVISFEWGHRLVFTLYGEQAPESRNFGMMAVPPAVVPEAAEGQSRLGHEALLSAAKAKYPDWLRIGLPLVAASGEAGAVQAVELDVYVPDSMPSRGWIPVEVSPYTGDVLQAVEFESRSPGLQTRVWMRFIHTGAAFGILGKIVATLATAASLFLVYTGFALSYRRFFR